MSRIPTTSQTAGPFFTIGLAYRFSNALCTEDTDGEQIVIRGVLYDGGGVPVPDAQLELWQADPRGHYPGLASGEEPASKGFRGFARVPTDEAGQFFFRTVRPGVVTAPDGSKQAPHIVVILLMRGLLRHLYTRIYFADETGNQTDRALCAVPEDRRYTLLAKPVAGKSAEYIWNIFLQGDDETAFFAY